MIILFCWLLGIVAAIAAVYIAARVSSMAYFRTRAEYDQERSVRNYINRSRE